MRLRFPIDPRWTRVFHGGAVCVGLLLFGTTCDGPEFSFDKGHEAGLLRGTSASR